MCCTKLRKHSCLKLPKLDTTIGPCCFVKHIPDTTNGTAIGHRTAEKRPGVVPGGEKGAAVLWQFHGSSCLGIVYPIHPLSNPLVRSDLRNRPQVRSSAAASSARRGGKDRMVSPQRKTWETVPRGSKEPHSLEIHMVTWMPWPRVRKTQKSTDQTGGCPVPCEFQGEYKKRKNTWDAHAPNTKWCHPRP